MFILPAILMQVRLPDQPVCASDDGGYEHSLEHLVAVMVMVERDGAGADFNTAKAG